MTTIHPFAYHPARSLEDAAAVEIPPGASGVQRYHELMQRDAPDFALVGLAATRRQDGGVRLAPGGVAPRPYRAKPTQLLAA